MKALEEFLRPTQKGLYKILSKMYPNAICSKKEYILVPGEAPIMLLAHLDTVHSQPVQTICKNKEKNILMSPQGIGGDDRCGVYAIVNAYDMAVKKPWLLFTCDEEIGGLGADQFCYAHADCKLPKELDDLKLLVEIDRRGSNDAVYYDCDNEEFEKYITSKGFRTAFGSFSDISFVAPELGVAAVNLSSGYYNAHTLHEYINRKELDAVLQKVNEIVADAAQPNFPKYKYVERKEFEYNSTYYSKYYQQITYHDGKKTTIWVDSQGKNCTKIYTKYRPLGQRGSNEVQRRKKKLSFELEGIYDELLDLYTEEELDRYIDEFGEQILYEIYINEYSPYYTTEEGVKITAIPEK